MGSRPTSKKVNVTIQDAKMIFPHFSGAQTPKNREGDRNFGLLLTQEQADLLKSYDYNVKVRKAMPATEEYEERPEEYFLTCKLGYNGRTPPRVVMVTCINDVCKRSALTEDTVILLDTANVSKVDCIVGPYDWGDVNDGGRTAYVQSMFVTVELDELEQKYAEIPDANQPAAALLPIEGPVSDSDR